MWYMIQTEEGREQQLIDAVRNRAGEEAGSRLFCLRREAVWRREGRCITHVETLFPGCIFIEDDGEKNFLKRLEDSFRQAGIVCPEGSEEMCILDGAAGGGSAGKSGEPVFDDARPRGESFVAESPGERLPVHPIREEDRRILEQLLDGDGERIVRLSPVELDEQDEEKRIISCGGALRHYQQDIVKKRIRLRYVIVRLPFQGGLRDILLGIRLKGDDEAPAAGLA